MILLKYRQRSAIRKHSSNSERVETIHHRESFVFGFIICFSLPPESMNNTF